MKLALLIAPVLLVGCEQEYEPHMTATLPHHMTHVDDFQDNFLPRVFEAIRVVETGGCEDPSNAVGADGELGPFQISRAYFQDAIDHDQGLTGIEYEGVRDSHISRLIMMAYWDRYAKEWTPEELCRLHNGGPTKRYTDAYWNKCKRWIYPAE